jgi:hypothetical protein
VDGSEVDDKDASNNKDPSDDLDASSDVDASSADASSEAGASDAAGDSGDGQGLLVPRGTSPFVGEQTGDTLGANARSPTFGWAAVMGALRYELQVDDSCTTPDFAACVFASPEIDERNLSAPSFTPSTPLAVSSSPPVGRRYYWRRRACSASGCDPWSPVLYVDVDRKLRDYNGDGYSDVIIGTGMETVTPQQLYKMHVHVFLGGAQPDATSDLDLPIDVNRYGSDFRTISSIDPVGDGNADGFPDFVVHDTGFDVYRDRGYWFSGAATLSSMHSEKDLGGGGRSRPDTLGVGDIDGDGYPDLAHPTSGYYGPCATLELRTGSLDLEPTVTSSHTCVMDAAGDLDGDGFGDLWLGDVDRGADTLLPTTLSFLAGGPGVDGKPELTLSNIEPKSIAGSIDLNGDKYADIVALNVASLEVRFGGSSRFASADLVLPANRLLGAEDFDGDGYPDVLAATQDAVTLLLEVKLFLGGPSMDATADLTFVSASDGRTESPGGFVGDVNGDGRSDVVLSAPTPTGGDLSSPGLGHAYLYLGGMPPDAVVDLTYSGAPTEVRFGELVSSPR